MRKFQIFGFVSLILTTVLFVSCGKIKPPNYPNNFTKTPTPTPTPVNTKTPTATLTGSPILPTFTSTPLPGLTNTSTPTIVPTLIFTYTSTYTITSCSTATMTPTGSANMWTSPPVHYITGSFSYTGSGTVDSLHAMTVGRAEQFFTNTFPPFRQLGGVQTYNSGNGTYLLGTNTSTGILQLFAYYDLKGSYSYIPADQIHPYSNIYNFPPFAGERYSCVSFPATITASSPLTIMGPTITLDDSCGYWGVYGSVTYSGTLGGVELCRKLNIQAFSDAAYTTQVKYTSFRFVPMTYNFVTNDPNDANQTGLAPLYFRAWYDANGSGTFNTGDPYLELGPVTPTTDGLHQNITFGDSFIK